MEDFGDSMVFVGSMAALRGSMEVSVDSMGILMGNMAVWEGNMVSGNMAALMGNMGVLMGSTGCLLVGHTSSLDLQILEKKNIHMRRKSKDLISFLSLILQIHPFSG
jgi:hypothetical protein